MLLKVLRETTQLSLGLVRARVSSMKQTLTIQLSIYLAFSFLATVAFLRRDIYSYPREVKKVRNMYLVFPRHMIKANALLNKYLF